ncbi:hypothetical protein L2E82_33241 [Cichorium intybus]|uniref:Uncharacterized protein n=1 Tax=Cichorium intybus TaxID=13427 RepID=A0ACB9BJN0_CICIN|nr:hypothetical protein L2E82_33241 [Cichorium intybus]
MSTSRRTYALFRVLLIANAEFSEDKRLLRPRSPSGEPRCHTDVVDLGGRIERLDVGIDPAAEAADHYCGRERSRRSRRRPPVVRGGRGVATCAFSGQTHLEEADKIYSEMIRNLMVDARSTGKYYHFVRLMGRAASHITLECALQTHPNIAIIGEEVQSLIEVAKIETEKMLIQMVETELEKKKREGRYKRDFKGQPHFFGYEGRCGLPSKFDSNYCYALGYGAAALIHSGKTGLISSVGNLGAPVEDWTVGGTALTSLMDVERRHGTLLLEQKLGLLDSTDMSPTKFRSFMEHLSNKYYGNTYHLIAKNCNHFTNEVSMRLTEKPIPSWVNRLAKLILEIDEDSDSGDSSLTIGSEEDKVDNHHLLEPTLNFTSIIV